MALALARELEIDKTLAWRAVRLARATDPWEAAAHVPGPAGFRILIEAFVRSGAEASALDALRVAVDDFDAMVRTHAGDRPTLDLLLASSAPQRMDGKQLEAGRRQAFRGGSAVWGVQARTRYLARAIAPNREEPDLADLASIAGFLDFRRLRPVTAWPLLHLVTYQDGVEIGVFEPMVPVRDGAPPVLEEFSSGPLPDFGSVREGRDLYFTLPEGPVGNTGTFSCAFGWLDRHVGPLHAERAGDVAENYAVCTTPVELLQFDLFVHHDIPLPAVPGVSLQAEMPGPRFQLASHTPARDLPLAERVLELGAPPEVSTPHVPRYDRIAARVCAALDRTLEEFRGFRVVVRYPSVPTRVVLSFPLTPRE